LVADGAISLRVEGAEVRAGDLDFEGNEFGGKFGIGA
jgi:hypothetical protein